MKYSSKILYYINLQFAGSASSRLYYQRGYEHGKEKGLRLVPNLTFANIWPGVWQRLTVRLATQLFSRRMSIALKILRENSVT